MESCSVLRIGLSNARLLTVVGCFYILSTVNSRTLMPYYSSMDEIPQNTWISIFERTRKSQDWVAESNCTVHKHEIIHTVMDRVCEMCHEMFSHQHSSLRAECRKGCFDNEWFRRCLNLFSAGNENASQNERRLPTAADSSEGII
uniref:Uncharacterized protein n=1 Tax=Heterorhabditis bacteriophora TaxID=37862 RepID=A0A1I7WL96_HETBA